jgi:hypothetical protein
MTTKRIKFHAAIIVNGKLPNRNKVLDEVRSDKNIIKMKIVQKLSGTSGGDRYTGTVADNNVRSRRSERG